MSPCEKTGSTVLLSAKSKPYKSFSRPVILPTQGRLMPEGGKGPPIVPRPGVAATRRLSRRIFLAACDGVVCFLARSGKHYDEYLRGMDQRDAAALVMAVAGFGVNS